MEGQELLTVANLLGQLQFVSSGASEADFDHDDEQGYAYTSFRGDEDADAPSNGTGAATGAAPLSVDTSPASMSHRTTRTMHSVGSGFSARGHAADRTPIRATSSGFLAPGSVRAHMALRSVEAFSVLTVASHDTRGVEGAAAAHSHADGSLPTTPRQSDPLPGTCASGGVDAHVLAG